MKKLDEIKLNLKDCQDELIKFKKLLDSKKILKESEDILPFFKENRNLIAYLCTCIGFNVADRIASEFKFFGDFIADYVVGNSKKMEFSAKNDKIARTIDQLDLTNEQKSDILKVERDFDRSLEKLTVKSISSPEFMSEYEKLKVIRNEGVMSILTAEQKKLLK